MTKQITEHEITFTETQLQLRRYARVVNVQNKRGFFCLSVESDPKQPWKYHTFKTFKIGEDIPENGVYLGTRIRLGAEGAISYHLYEILANKEKVRELTIEPITNKKEKKNE